LQGGFETYTKGSSYSDAVGSPDSMRDRICVTSLIAVPPREPTMTSDYSNDFCVIRGVSAAQPPTVMGDESNLALPQSKWLSNPASL
jgi:hypothetical protein